jgi:hypothetical protein
MITAHLLYLLTGLEIALFREDLGKDPTPETGLLERFLPVWSKDWLVLPLARWIEFLRATINLPSYRSLAQVLADHAGKNSDLETGSKQITRLKSDSLTRRPNRPTWTTLTFMAQAAERACPATTEIGILITAVTARLLTDFTWELAKTLPVSAIPDLFAPLQSLRTHHLKSIFPPMT